MKQLGVEQNHFPSDLKSLYPVELMPLNLDALYTSL